MKKFYYTKFYDNEGNTHEVYATDRNFNQGVLEVAYSQLHGMVLVECDAVYLSPEEYKNAKTAHATDVEYIFKVNGHEDK